MKTGFAITASDLASATAGWRNCRLGGKGIFAARARMCLLLFWTLGSPAVQATNRVAAIRVPIPGNVVKAQLGVDGTIHLLLDAAAGPQYVNSRDGGASFSAPISVVDPAGLKPGLKFSAWDLALGQDGRVHVAMGNNAWKLKLPKEEWSLYYATLDPKAKAFSSVRNLNRKPSEGFSLAANADGAVTACYLSGKLYAMVSRDGGDTFTASAEINSAWNPCDCCTTSATYGRDGKVAVLYREETDNERDMYLVLWDTTGKAKPSRVRVSRTPWAINGCPMTYFALSPTATGYVAAWPTKGQVFFARLNQNGEVLPPGEIKTPGTSGMRTGILTLYANDGVTLVAWKNKDILGWQLYNAMGQPEETPGSGASQGNGAAGVVLPDGRFILFL